MLVYFAVAFDNIKDHLNTDIIILSPRNNHIAVLHLWFDVLLEVNLDESVVSFKDLVNVPAPLLDISDDSSSQANIWVAVYENLNVKEIPYWLLIHAHNSLKNKYILHLDCFQLSGGPVLFEIINLVADLSFCYELLQSLSKQVHVQRFGMIEVIVIRICSFGQTLVKVIHSHYGYSILQLGVAHYFLNESCLARCGSSFYATLQLRLIKVYFWMPFIKYNYNANWSVFY